LGVTYTWRLYFSKYSWQEDVTNVCTWPIMICEQGTAQQWGVWCDGPVHYIASDTCKQLPKRRAAF